jgi:putative ABC transport system permease protein
MRLVERIRLRLRSLFCRGQVERELGDELRFHLEQQIHENEAAGMSPEEARRAAQRLFGGQEQVKEECRDRRGITLIETTLRDLGYGMRMLRKHPGFTAVAVLTLGLGIGANTAVFSVINAVLLQPLPYPEADRLVVLYNSYTKIMPDLRTYGSCCNSAPDYLDRREEKKVFESLTLLDFESYGIGSEDSLRRVNGLRVTPSFFSVLQTFPLLGRVFAETQTVPGNERVVILSHGLWQQMYAGSASALGHSIRIDGVPHEILGVMPPGFDVLSREPELFVPLVFTERQKTGRHGNFAFMLARLRSGVGIELARERMRALDARNLERFPELRSFAENWGFATVVASLHDEMVQNVRPTLYLLQAGVAFVLLIGCVNIANLLLIRSAGRRQELAVRLALGAGRWRVIRQLWTESLLLGLVGGAAGLLLGVGSMPALVWFGAAELPRAGAIGIDTTVVIFVMMSTIVTGLICGLISALHVSRDEPGQVMLQSGRTSSAGRSASATRRVLAVAEVSLAFVLLSGAGLMMASFMKVLAVDPGFSAEQTLTARLSLPASRYGSDEELQAFSARLQEAVEALPGVRSAGLTTLLPFSGDLNKSVVTVEGHELAPGEATPTPHNAWVTAGYLAAMGIPLLEGRAFEARDDAAAPLVAIVDRDFADHYWPDESPIGKRVHRGGGDGGRSMSIIGVVGPVRVDDLGAEDPRGAAYFCQTQPSEETYLPLRRDLSLVVRAKAPAVSLGETIRTAVLGLDPQLPLYDIQMMRGRLADSLRIRRVPMTLLLVFAGVALLLSAIGVYGVLASSVSQRTREIGIQMALGVTPGRLLRQVLSQGLGLVLLGLAGGLAAAFGLMRLIRSLLYEVEPTEPSVLALVAGVLALVAVGACLIPARRATRVDVVTALRCE